MRNFLASICLLLYHLPCTAQSPQKFSFQGIARSIDGKTVSNAVVGIRISIRSASPAGEIVYQETQAPLTGYDGIFNIKIGEGNGIVGNVGAILWKKHAHYLQLEMDVSGGASYIDLGTTQLLSVPYALHSEQAAKWSDGYPVVQKNDVLVPGDPDIAKHRLPTVGAGSRLIWYPKKAAFRAGIVGNGAWEDAQIGDFSAAFGTNTLASGANSAAFGTASLSTTANSFATGNETSASGWASATFGSHTAAKANGSFTAGFFNDNTDNPHPALLDPADRIFQIGNGDNNARKNAVTVLRNGNIGFGSVATSPTHILDVGGRLRIRHKDATAGLFFDNSSAVPTGFVGMITDDNVGFYLGKWRWQVHSNGAVATGGGNAIGDESVALGPGTTAKAYGAVTIGAFNNVQDNSVGNYAGAKTSDRIFQIGNGMGNQALSNALTVQRNGNVGIGNNALFPTHILEVGGRARIHHNGSTAGIHFDNSQHQVDGFVGMKTDDQVGLYLGNSWMFWVDNGGTGYINNAIVQTSDRRLKRDFVPLSSSLGKLTSLNGYHYFWKDKERDPSLQTGLIAQEVEKLFPELVKTDSKGFKSLNYTGLIPHLIEAVKSLKSHNEALAISNANLQKRLRRIEDVLQATPRRSKDSQHRAETGDEIF
ncbi:tail fiber domain-containing protein [Dyadobacter fermentans]|uniref:Peptidase S74 domain-containing protein n=1 Tax=Dyadobacter fermentans (strain ATCC 700827 / DSM 18053 / CIP 107007 / KCTC 52180 / NS114) TaxID=471854 RepID=C6VS36_DYAFD|nr:tail fiber domain-containing protein [Dyadobacter fermentans]ACT94557.1 hypothetical protein Dfer_3346 [Dyadobacter fermentans DSM 18053]